jgi:hypothetical protein
VAIERMQELDKNVATIDENHETGHKGLAVSDKNRAQFD